MENLHHEDHKHLLEHMNVNKEVAAIDKDVALIKEKFKDEKEDKSRQSRMMMGFGGMLFSIVMAVAGFAIDQKATVQVLQEKVKEQKDEINKLNIYVQDIEQSLRDDLDYHAAGDNH